MNTEDHKTGPQWKYLQRTTIKPSHDAQKVEITEVFFRNGLHLRRVGDGDYEAISPQGSQLPIVLLGGWPTGQDLDALV